MVARRAALFRPVAVVVLALLSGTLACTLRVSPENTRGQTEAELPTVTILDPATDGMRVNKGQDVLVKARAVSSSGVTLVELLVNGVRVDSQIPADAISLKALDVMLDYKADQAGTITLGVRAYSNSAMGQTAQRTITVVDPLNPGQGVSTGTPFPTSRPGPTATTNPLCRARINTGLNFRKGPGTTYEVISTFAAGIELPIAGYSDRSDGRWWQVASGGQYGWISAAYTTQLGDCSLIRPVAAPPTITAVPSLTPPPTLPGTTSTPTLPDLVFSMFEGVSDLTIGIDGTAQATYIIRVKNQGGQMSGQFIMAVALPSGEIKNYDVPGLNVGQEFQVPSTGLNVTFNKPGATRLVLTVDANNVIAESNEGNNQTYKDIVVNPAPVPTPTATTQVNNIEAIPQAESVAVNTDAEGFAIAGSLQSAEIGIGGEPVQAAAWQGHSGKVAGLSFSPAGSYIASASLDGTVRLWNITTGIEHMILVGHADRVVSVDFSGDGAYVVSGSWDGTARVWDVESGAEVARFSHGAEVNAVAFSPSGALVASGGENGRVMIWRLSDQTVLWEFYAYGPVSGVALPTDELLIVSSRSSNCTTGDGAVERYELTNGTLLDFLSGHSNSIEALAINYGGTVIAGSGQTQLCAGNEVIWVWNGTGALLQTLDQASVAPIALALDPLGSLLAASSADGSVRVWDIMTGTQLYVLTGNAGEASGVAFSPDSAFLASGGSDNTVRLWTGFIQ